MNNRDTIACSRYLERIHFPVSADLASLKPSLQALRALHEAHLLAVPFENLSIHYNQPIILQAEALFHKIVELRRGGFCYELNGLFAWLLRQLGFQVTLLSAGVVGEDGEFGPEFDHLTLLIRGLDNADWLADVGFGDSFRLPLRFEADLEQEEADGRKYRLKRENAEHAEHTRHEYWLLQQFDFDGEQWTSQYRFTLQPRALSDFTEMCYYQQTSPESHFTQKRVCSLATPTGRITLSDLKFIASIAGKREERTLQSEEEYRAVLAERFGIVL